MRFMSDETFRQSGVVVVVALAHIGTFLAGYLSARIARSHGMVFAMVSVWIGTSLGGSEFSPDLLAFFPGFYPFVAAFGGGLAALRRA